MIIPYPMRRHNLALLACLFVCVWCARAASPIPVKVVVVTMFEDGADTGDRPGEYQLWVEREHLDRVIEIPSGFHHVRMNKDGVLGMLTGVGTAKAAASVMALGLDPRFDLSKAYWVVAGIGGGDPEDVSLASAVWAEHVIDGDLAYEIDARDIPSGWSTGYVPLRKAVPYEQPVRRELEGEIYTLNPDLVRWAYGLTRGLTISDSETLRMSRARFTGMPNALKAPFVTRGDTVFIKHVLARGEDGPVGQRLDPVLHRRRQLHDFGDGRYRHAAGLDLSECRGKSGSEARAGAANR